MLTVATPGFFPRSTLHSCGLKQIISHSTLNSKKYLICQNKLSFLYILFKVTASRTVIGGHKLYPSRRVPLNISRFLCMPRPHNK
jgi:hypothetical protein